MNLLNILSVVILTSQFAVAEGDSFEALTNKINESEFKQITSVVVSQNDVILYEQYFKHASANTKHDMRSASKSLTSLAIGLLIEEGVLTSVNQPVLSILSEKKSKKNYDNRKLAITIQDLLTMSSVLECDDWNSASRGNEERMYLIEDWSQFILDLPIRGIPPWKKTPEKSKYGRSFSYCTGGVQILTEVVEKLTKMKMSDYLQKKLFSPLGINAPQFSYTPLGHTNGGGGAQLSSKDWMKIGNLILHKGQYENNKIIADSWLNQSFVRRAVIDEEKGIEYGYLWWIFDFQIENRIITAYAAAGNGGNYLFILPQYNAVAVITSRAYNTNYMHQQSQQILTDYIIPNLEIVNQ